MTSYHTFSSMEIERWMLKEDRGNKARGMRHMQKDRQFDMKGWKLVGQ